VKLLSTSKAGLTNRIWAGAEAANASHAAVARAAIDELLASIVIRLPLKGLLALWWAAAPRDTYQS
jgi:hypothetical protein